MSSRNLAVQLAPWLLPGFALCFLHCSRAPQRSVERIAVAPFENHSASADADWMGPLAPVLIAQQSSGAPRTAVIAVNRAADTRLARATRLIEGYYTAGSQLHFHAVLRDLTTNQIIGEADSAGELARGPQPLLEKIAIQLAGKARDLRQVPPAAMESMGRSLFSHDIAESEKLLKKALEADPAFSQAAATLAQRLVAMQDVPAARALLTSTIGRLSEGWEKTQLKIALANIEGNKTATIAGLEEAAQMSPYDSEITRQLGERLLSSHRYTDAIRWYSKSVQIDPGEAPFWNVLSYAQSYVGDRDGALASLAEYRKLAPNDPNSSDTTGEVHLFFGMFAEAEKNFLEAQQKSPQFLGGLEFAKAAMARYLAGDVSGADSTFQRYIETRRALSDPLADIRQAAWLRLTGRHPQAFQQIRELVKRGDELGAIAEIHNAFWLVHEGKSAEALQSVKRALSLAKTPSTFTQAGIVGFLAQPAASAEEWTARADRTLNPQTHQNLRRLIMAYAMLLGKHFNAAVQSLEPLYNDTPPGVADELRMLLGYAKLQTGDKAAAIQLLKRYPLPPQPGESITSSFWFPAFREWRKAAGLQ